MRKQNGITLIALVITIIVILILSMISVALLTGSNSIINKAAQSREVTNQAEATEKVQLEVAASYNNDGSVNLEQLKTNLQKDLEITDASGDTESGTLTFTYGGYSFEVNNKAAITVTKAE